MKTQSEKELMSAWWVLGKTDEERRVDGQRCENSTPNLKIEILKEPSSKELIGKVHGEIGVGTHNRLWIPIDSKTVEESGFSKAYKEYKKEGYIYIYVNGGVLWKSERIEIKNGGNSEWMQIWLIQEI